MSNKYPVYGQGSSNYSYVSVESIADPTGPDGYCSNASILPPAEMMMRTSSRPNRTVKFDPIGSACWQFEMKNMENGWVQSNDTFATCFTHPTNSVNDLCEEMYFHEAVSAPQSPIEICFELNSFQCTSGNSVDRHHLNVSDTRQQSSYVDQTLVDRQSLLDNGNNTPLAYNMVPKWLAVHARSMTLSAYTTYISLMFTKFNYNNIYRSLVYLQITITNIDQRKVAPMPQRVATAAAATANHRFKRNEQSVKSVTRTRPIPM